MGLSHSDVTPWILWLTYVIPIPYGLFAFDLFGRGWRNTILIWIYCEIRSCAAIDLAARRITYSGAGHPPSLLLRQRTGEVLQLAENGFFIGPFPHPTYSNLCVPFQNGDKLLLYTDGIVEATVADGQEFGRERFEEFLRTSAALKPGEAVTQLFRNLPSTQQDDLTVVLAEFA